MDFTRTSIVPKGRYKYGQYISAGNVAIGTAQYTYGGNASTGGNSGSSDEPEIPQEDTNFVIFLEKTYNTFKRQEVDTTGATDSIRVVAYRNSTPVPVYIMDCSKEIQNQSNPPASSTTYNITGLPVNGLSVSVSGNGTTACTINVTMRSGFTGTGGSLLIPANVSSDYNVSGNTYSTWLMENEANSNKFGGTPSLFSTQLQYNYYVDTETVATTGYQLTLTNDSAGINAGLDGNVLPGALRPTSSAKLWYGTQDITSAATFTGTTNEAARASGVTVAANGQISFASGSSFNFLGTGLEVNVRCDYSGITLYKTFNLTKQYPGENGEGATTRWIVLSHSQIKVHTNSGGTMTPSTINAKIMMQVNDNEPTEDTASVLYWGWDTETPTTTGHTNTNITVVAGHSYLAVGLKNSSNDFYELETVEILEDGLNGSQGTSGQSVYQLQLSNQFDFVNVDSDGYVVTGQSSVLGTTATLYYGNDPASNVVYSFVEEYGGIITIDSATGEVFFDEGFDVFFAGDTLEIQIQATLNNIRRGIVSYKLIKNYPAVPGEPARRYWLNLSATASHIDSGATVADPAVVTAETWMQVGGEVPVRASGCSITYGYDTTNPIIGYPVTGITVPTDKHFITIKLSKDGVQQDIQTVLILRDGADGQSIQGRTGAAIRGPYEWTGGEDRRFSSGSGTTEDEMFIDIIFRMSGNTKIYYRCVSSYTQTSVASWDSVKANWQQSDVNYDFVAADLILGENAKIKFLTGNEIYVTNTGGTVCGGMRGASSGDTIVFWAGADEPSNGNFKVDNNGSITATTGSIGPWVISGNTGLGFNNYDGTENYRNSHLDTNEISIWERFAGGQADFTAGLNGISYSTDIINQKGLNIEGGNVHFSEGSTDAKMYIDMPIYSKSGYTTENTIQFGSPTDFASGLTMNEGALNAVGSLFLSNLKVAICTNGNVAANYFSNVGGKLYFNGDMNLGISYVAPTVGTGGMWYAGYTPLGIYDAGATGFTKKGDTIYITID